MKIEAIREKTRVEGNYLLTRKDMAVGKSGKPYIITKLMDCTGEVEARVWDKAEALADNFSKDDVCRVEGFAVSYQGAIQVNISAIASLPEGKYSLRDYLPSTEREPDVMMEELTAIIATMDDKDLRGFFDLLFADGSEVLKLFKLAPAAKTMHHNRLGGLLEHVLSLAKLADFVAGHYNNINRDMLIAGVVLHDIGKIYELSYKRSFDYTDSGQLLGHITIGAGMVDETTARIKGFPADKAILMKHMILSHHGVLEYGSPKLPMTLEAVVLSFLDDLDAKVESLQAFIKKDQGEGNWTAYHRLLTRYIFKGFTPKLGVNNDDEGIESTPQGQGEGHTKEKKDNLNLF